MSFRRPRVSHIDSEAPTAPSNLVVTTISETELSLTWDASTDNSGGVYQYAIYRDGVFLDNILATSTSYSDTGLTPITTYSYYIKALDYAGNISSASNTDSALTGYSYGWPAAGTSEPNVSCQFTFNQASGSLVDTVSSVTLAATGSIQFQQAGTGGYGGFLGTKFDQNLEYFNKGTSTVELAPGTGDFTIEAVVTLGTTRQDSTILHCYTGAEHGYLFIMRDTSAYIYTEATDSTADLWLPMASPTVYDNTTHKYRLVGRNRGTASAQLELFLDGASQGTHTYTSMNGKSIPASRASFGWWEGTLYKMSGIMHELRFSKNATNNSGGPNGG